MEKFLWTPMKRNDINLQSKRKRYMTIDIFIFNIFIYSFIFIPLFKIAED